MSFKDVIKRKEEELAKAQAKVRRLKKDLPSLRAIYKVKIDWKHFEEYLTEDDRQRIPDKVREWLPKEYVEPVLSACASYRYYRAHVSVIAPGPPTIPPGGLKRSKGRPPGGDVCAKALINELASIWCDAGKNLPKKGDNSRFGKFVADIARGLKATTKATAAKGKSTTWPGIVNEVLRGGNHKRFREARQKGLCVIPDRDTFDAAKDENWLQQQEKKKLFVLKAWVAAAQAVFKKQRVEAEIEKILDSVQDENVLKLIDSKIIKRRKDKKIEGDEKSS